MMMIAHTQGKATTRVVTDVQELRVVTMIEGMAAITTTADPDSITITTVATDAQELRVVNMATEMRVDTPTDARRAVNTIIAEAKTKAVTAIITIKDKRVLKITNHVREVQSSQKSVLEQVLKAVVPWLRSEELALVNFFFFNKKKRKN
jgi:hypothetical protein